MIAPFSVIPTPEVENARDVPELLEQMRCDGLPAFVINNVALNEISGVMEEQEIPLRAGGEARLISGGYRDNKRDLFLGFIAYDKPMHIDTKPIDGVLKHPYVHHTMLGAHVAHFFEVTEGFRNKMPELQRPLLPANAQELFEAGQVDDEVLEPVDHQATVRKGSTVIFRQTGHTPLAHYFETTEFPRSSIIYMGTVLKPVLPQAELPLL